MADYLTCLKKKNHSQRHYSVCISLRCPHIERHIGPDLKAHYFCNYKTRFQRTKEKKENALLAS